MPTSAFGVKPPSRAYAQVAIGEMNDLGDVCEVNQLQPMLLPQLRHR